MELAKVDFYFGTCSLSSSPLIWPTLWIGKWGWGLGKWVGLGKMEMENREPAEVHSTAIIGV